MQADRQRLLDIISILGGDWLLDYLELNSSDDECSDINQNGLISGDVDENNIKIDENNTKIDENDTNINENDTKIDENDTEVDEVDIELVNNYVHQPSIDHIVDSMYRKFVTDGKYSNLSHVPMLQCYVAKSNLETYFDKIFVLNLDRRVDRWDHMRKVLRKNNITSYDRLPGVDAQDPVIYSQWDSYRRKPLSDSERRHRLRKKGIPSAGSWAILSGMKKMLETCIQQGYRRVLVLQDDLIFHKNFEAEFMKLDTVIPQDWKLLYLGASQHNWGPEVTFSSHKSFYYPNGTADGAFAVGIDHTVFNDLIKEIDRREMPFDSGALCAIQKKHQYQCMVVYPNLIIADVRDSDLRDSRNLRGLGDKFRWNLGLYDITNH